MTGLFFGSFNPIHNGHLEIATYLLDQHFCKDIWFIISPRNPFKPENSLLDENKRLKIVEKAIRFDPRMCASDVEFSLPKPSYTIDTLRKLNETYPDRKFALIIGADNLLSLHLWKKYQTILEKYTIFVYPRPGIDISGFSYPSVVLVNAPLTDISSTEIRQRIQRKEDITNFVPREVQNLIIRNYTGLWEK